MKATERMHPFVPTDLPGDHEEKHSPYSLEARTRIIIHATHHTPPKCFRPSLKAESPQTSSNPVRIATRSTKQGPQDSRARSPWCMGEQGVMICGGVFPVGA